MNTQSRHATLLQSIPRLFVLLFLMLLATPGPLFSAPLPPIGKVQVQGTVIRTTWVPKVKHKAIAGMSGSAGRDRVMPAHLVVTLKDYSGPTAAQARMMNTFVAADAPQPTLTIWITTEDRDSLKPGMRIRVKGYTVTGDEGGTWTSHQSIEILSRAAP